LGDGFSLPASPKSAGPPVIYTGWRATFLPHAPDAGACDYLYFFFVSFLLTPIRAIFVPHLLFPPSSSFCLSSFPLFPFLLSCYLPPLSLLVDEQICSHLPVCRFRANPVMHYLRDRRGDDTSVMCCPPRLSDRPEASGWRTRPEHRYLLDPRTRNVCHGSVQNVLDKKKWKAGMVLG